MRVYQRSINRDLIKRAMKTKRFQVTDEFGSNITSIVDVVNQNGNLHVINEFGADITGIVSIVEVSL